MPDIEYQAGDIVTPGLYQETRTHQFVHILEGEILPADSANASGDSRYIRVADGPDDSTTFTSDLGAVPPGTYKKVGLVKDPVSGALSEAKPIVHEQRDCLPKHSHDPHRTLYRRYEPVKP